MARRQINLADIEGILKCGICLETFKDPRSLSCIHSFCLECLTQHVSSTKKGDGTFRCPQCRTECTVPGGDSMKNFPKNFLAIQLMDKLPAPIVQQLSSTNCDRHLKLKINRYCRTCTLPVCSECMEEEHIGHLLNLHKLMLQSNLDRVRKASRKQFDKAKEELNIALENTSSLMSSTKSSSERDVALCTAIEAPNVKKQFLGQEELCVPSAEYTIIKYHVKPSDLISTGNYVGDIETSTSSERQTYVKAETGNLGTPIQTIKLDYTGKRSVVAIAPIHKTMVCVAYSSEPDIWVYSNTGQLMRQLTIPGIEKVYGMVTVNKSEGQVAIVDGFKPEVHLVTSSERLQVVQHTTVAVPIVAGRISIDQNNQLIVNHTEQKQIVTLQPDGQLVSNIQVPIPHDKVFIVCAAQTRSGFVISDRENRQVYFTDVKGHILHTSADCVDPRRAVQTSWGHVVIADGRGHEIKAFSEHGDFLGNVHDNNGSVTYPQYIHLDEAEGLVYVARGPVGEIELRTYKFAPSDLPPLPLQRSVKKLTVDIKLAKVKEFLEF